MASEIELKDVHNAFDELKKELDAKLQDVGKIARLEKALDEYENKQEAARKEAAAAAEKAKGELAAQFDELKNAQRSMMERLGSAKGGDVDPRENETYKAFMTYAKMGRDGLEGPVKKALLREGDSLSAGVLVPTVIERAIIKNITETSPVRARSRVVNTTSTSIQIPRRLNILIAQYEGEAEAAQESVSQYGLETIHTHRLAVTVPVTNDLLLGAFTDIEAELVGDASEAFAKAEGLNFLHGDGVKKPSGIVVNTDVETVLTAAVATLTLDDMVTVSGQLKVGYNPWYYMNRRTLAYLRRQKGSDGQFLWSPAIADGAGPTLNGYPYDAAFIDLDSYDGGSNAVPVIFGDLQMGYRIYDRTGMTFIRDDYSKKNQDIVEWTFRMYNDGRVVQPEAIKLLKLQ